MEKDIIITDENFQFASHMIKNYGNFLHLHLAVYEWVLDQIVIEAVQDQNISKILRSWIENLKGVKENIQEAADTIGRWSVSFVEEIDEADQFLYLKGK